jgi:transcription initiation factor IIE alpha subunit|uniref:ArsR family transcriptional regulator n=1 Tax=Ignisphaera aggregans TaxID=334771 RepID=A0A7J2T938_9CREN
MFVKRRIQQKILEYLKEKGEATDKELLEIIGKEFSISYTDLLKILMYLEIEGYIEVKLLKDSFNIVQKTASKRRIL